MVRRSLILLPLVLAGCGSHERVVGWRDLPPTGADTRPIAIVPSLPKHARYCDGSSLRFSAAGSQPMNSMMAVSYFKIRNLGSKTCALQGRPDVTVSKSGGYRVRLANLPGMYGEKRFAERTFGLRPGHSAHLALFVGRYCGEPSTPRVPALVVLHAVGQDVRVPLTNCRFGLDLSLEPFQPDDPLPPERRLRLPFDVSIVGHPHARSGTTLVYRVRVRNVSSRPFRFPWCPIVDEWIDGQNGPVFTLNCRPVGTIAPHGSVLFLMHYKLSPYYRPGTRTLHWMLSNENHLRQVGDKTSVTIDP